MKTDDNHDKLRLIKHFFIFNMLQQPSCFININKKYKKNSANIKQENRYPNNLSTEKSSKDKISTEFMPKVQQVISENDSESAIPICDKSTMAKFLVILKLLQQPYPNRNMNKTSKSNPINIKNENRVIPNNLGLINNSKNKNSKFMFFIQRVTFKNNSESINKKSEINTADDIYENSDYLESSTPTLPIIIEEKDINTDIPIE
ncbi:hypothetical protein KPL47_21455 [Clostridium estertheticum]|uniref:hypothetical protein n=1 Tax=Clostridium estertheticum TaxID=238834 RepID=UPI001C0E5E31|nr:hypothetical protein [Clostridium estertheticum]MBU3178881.1 hypothetical protein [Clostridium estertheticum]